MFPGASLAIRNAVDSAVKQALNGQDLRRDLDYSIRVEVHISSGEIKARAALAVLPKIAGVL